MRFGIFASILFHLSIVGAIILWGHDWTKRGDLFVEPPIPVELISEARLAELTNVPTITTREVEAPDPEPVIPDDPQPILQPDPVIIEPEPEPVAAPPAPEPQPEPLPGEPEPVVEPEPEPALPKPAPPKPKPKPVEPPKPKSDGLDLDALEDLAKQAKNKPRDPNDTPGAKPGSVDVQGNGAGELTVSENAKLIAAMRRCWTPLDGAPNPERLRVEVSFRLRPNGTLQDRPKVLNAAQIALSPNRYWKVAQQRAVQAVIECQPYDFFAPERYGEEFILNFTPQLMGGF